MFSFPNGYVAVLLLISTQSLVHASFGDENIQTEALANAMVNSMQIPWISRIDSVIRSSETSCAEEIEAMTGAITAQETWALHMVDASSKIQSGILKGNVKDLGMYDECIEAKGQYNGIHVQGQYCAVSFSSLSSAVCVPSSCNETEVAELMNSIILDVPVIAGLELEISGVSCVRLGSEDFTTGEIITILFFSVVGAFIIFCTICEFVKKCKPTAISPVLNELTKFSLYTNTMALMSTKVTPQMMPAIHGLRFLSTCWVVLGHRYISTASGPMINALDLLDWYSSWPAIYIQTAPFAVDTFFVISGFLMAYLFFKSKQSRKISNFPMMYLHRYLRVTPCVAVIMLFYAVLLHRISNGPLWDSVYGAAANCQKNWWINLLYVQNLVDVNNMCIGHSWYLAVDMQLFWISPLVLYPLYRWPTCGLGVLGMFLLASVITPTVILAVNNYSNAVIRFGGPMDEVMLNFFKFYIPTYTRACAYFVGISLGYDVAKKRRHFSKVIVAINWILACIFMLGCGLATKRLYDISLEYNKGMEIAFSILLRPFWSIAIAWILYACIFGYGGPVARFLSLPIFLPLSRLSFGLYLVHSGVQVVKDAARLSHGRFSDFLWLNEVWADLALSITIAFFLSLFFESPVIVLEKILTNRGRKPTAPDGRRPVLESTNDVEGGIGNEGMKKTLSVDSMPHS